jgi:hypothetical protein
MGNHEGRRHSKDLISDGQNDIKIDLLEIGWGYEQQNLSGLWHERVASSCQWSKKLSGSIELLDQMSNYYLLKKEFASWSQYAIKECSSLCILVISLFLMLQYALHSLSERELFDSVQ